MTTIFPIIYTTLTLISFHLILLSGELSCYKNRQEYRTDPINRFKDKRPIDLEEYLVHASGGMGMDETTSVTASTTTSSGLPAFQITLKPKWDDHNRHFNLRCDTEEQLGEWLEAMKKTNPKSFLSPDAADNV